MRVDPTDAGRPGLGSIPNGIIENPTIHVRCHCQPRADSAELEGFQWAGHATSSLVPPAHIARLPQSYIASVVYLPVHQLPENRNHSPSSYSTTARNHGHGRDGPGQLPVELLPSHLRRDPAPHQRLQYLRLGFRSLRAPTTRSAFYGYPNRGAQRACRQPQGWRGR